MAFERVSTILKMADKANTSVIAFNCTDYNMAYSVVTVAEELKTPVLVMLYPGHSIENNVASLSTFAQMVRKLADDVKVPIGLHLDHCSDYGYLMHAIKSGFTSIMYDGSMLPVEENIKNTQKVVETAHLFSVDVEAELGHVGVAATASDQSNEDLYTKPEVTADFYERTNVDSIAVAVGSAHGVYKVTPKLDLARLEEINNATDVPLVMHGGSGIPEDQLEIAFRKGINKFNVGTEFFQLYTDSIKEYINSPGADVFGLPKYTQEKLMEYLRVKMLLSKFTY
ncbi:class II fructose-bisphosphate aldolase [Oscillospiraceae bacterium MB08-C2-2]|nr:class II fructose-bisphosphate aldolase [Oscillospiraceae bacterium MB08-C2-2]